MPKFKNYKTKKTDNKKFKKTANKKEKFNKMVNKYKNTGKPSEEAKVNVYLNMKGLKDLPKSSFGMQADPYDASMPSAQQYPLYNQFNKVIDVNYLGERNIDGGNVQQYGSSSTSGWLKCFDSGKLDLSVNYRFLPIHPNDVNRGKAFVDEMRKSIAESVSTLQATTFTNLAINDFVISTDMPMGSAVSSVYSYSKDGSEYHVDNCYDDIVDVIYGSSIFYQLVLQAAVHVMDWHNAFRLKQSAMLQSSWNREVPQLNALFGLFNKSSFLNLLKSISYSFESEYIDNDFRKQINTLVLTPSRRSDSMNDPILEVQAEYAHPTYFSIYLKTGDGTVASTPIFSMQRDMPTYWNDIHTISEKLSIEDTLKWARNTDLVSGEGLGEKGSNANSRFNSVKELFDSIITALTKFKVGFVDVRELFDIMSRTGVLYWEKGTQFYIEPDTSVQLLWNVLVDSLFRNCFAGDDTINFDSRTQRWKTYALWDIYKGVPNYDAMSGGSFLTFSSKVLLTDGSSDISSEQVEFLPILFNADNFSLTENPDARPIAKFINRQGLEVTLGVKTKVIRDDKTLARLAPLESQNSETIRVPIAYVSDDSDPMVCALVLKVITQIFGYGEVVDSADDTIIYTNSCDPDLLAIYNVEVADITNYAISYARSNAPFRGDKEAIPTLGFSTTSFKN